MAISAGKFIYCKAFELHSRVFLYPWGKTKIIVRCCSNFPVRYTPKKSSSLNKPNDPTPVPSNSEKLEFKQFIENDDFNKNVDWPRSRIRSNLDKKSPDFKSGDLRSKEKKNCNAAVQSEALEDSYKWRSVESNPVEEFHEFGVMEGLEDALDEFDSHNGEYEIKRLAVEPHNGEYEVKNLAVEPSKSKEEAEKTAIRLLAVRAYTALELKKKLSGKKFSPEVVTAVISDFQNRGLINDLLYAEAFSRSRWSISSWGPHRIKQALVKKGVNDVDAQKAIKLVLEDGEPVDDDQVSRFGLSKSSFDHLFAQASKQWIRAKDLPSERQKSRIVAWLQYRGFNWGVINFILKRLQSEHLP
ncbi:putative regulatory protein RecX [Helianthus annuus]|uniref:Regulatory protein RecX n=1 Tax=Helianthus annuus TaxID=4232 RepID=A0A251SAJ9_HELAN|nr:uncharacterized protein LOC110912314 [Helianthus annuus]KAF5781316.1 putative regulatory protein RecX [Helianthus annuus]KAJ0500945.1 putative regulatory protein RecX [Helianthus annuus]KAJ0508601.1 putative regulatory protein RecX [Helianthus annuus]KAJ0516835.1 putative regulatory protein RecX [Helianthus annuus]KAJ0684840.1 putative regulatory protein RecX [Helianthus annuus]